MKTTKNPFIFSLILAFLAPNKLINAAPLPPENVPYSFELFDNLVYIGQPDMANYGFQLCHINGYSMWEGQWPNYNMEQGYEPAVTAFAQSLSPNTLIVLDIEHWPLEGNPAEVAETVQKLIEIIDWMKAVNPNLVIGYYSFPPLSYYWPVYQYKWLMDIQDTPAWNIWQGFFPQYESDYLAWAQACDNLQALVEKVDVILPSLYTFYEDPYGWERRAEGLIEKSRTYGKPIYPYIWPEYHDSTPLAGIHIPGRYWRRQLEICRRYADGAVIWGGWQKPWNESAEWWQETVRFTQRNQNTVDARTAGAALNGTTDDRALLQSIIDNFPSAGGRLIIDGPAGIGAGGLKIHNKSNVFIQGIGETAGLVALSGSPASVINGQFPVLVSIENADFSGIEYLKIDLKNQAVGGVGVSYSNNVMVHKNVISNIASAPQPPLQPTGIVGFANQNNDYTDNNIANVAYGIHVTSLPGLDPELNAAISFNKIQTVTQGDGIKLTRGRASAERNIIWNVAKNGLVMTDIVAAGFPIKLISNVITTCQENGFLIERTDQGVLVDNLKIEKNTLSDNGENGASISKIKNSEINDNTVSNSGTAAAPAVGLKISEVDNIKIISNTLKDFRPANSKGQSAGLEIAAHDQTLNGTTFSSNSKNISLSGNQALGNLQDGIRVVADGNSTIDGLIIGGNSLYSNLRYGIYIHCFGQALNNLLIYLNTYISNGTAPIKNENYGAIKPLLEVYPNAESGKFDFYGTPLDGTDSYEIQISPQSDFSTLTYTAAFSISPHTVPFAFNGTYFCRLRGHSSDNASQYSQWSNAAELAVTSAQNQVSDTRFNRFKNVFNPARGEKAPIAFSLRNSGDASIIVYDRLGKVVAKLSYQSLSAGNHTADWDGRNTEGLVVASGVYNIVLQADGKIDKTKIIVLK